MEGLCRGFGLKDRDIPLLVDNCPVHPTVEGLTNIHSALLPPNTISVLHPMDQGVIRPINEKELLGS